MIELGKMNTLEIIRSVDFGVYVGDKDQEVLLPKKYVPESASLGDMIDVFIYKDSEDRPVATTEVPLIQLDQFASLQVKEVGNFGAFMDWGLEKDLLVPYKEQVVKMHRGERHVIRLCIDYKTDRLVGVAKIQGFLDKDTSTLKERQEVDVLIYGQTELGYHVLINNRYQGLVYHNEVFEKIEIGDARKGYIKVVREDGKVDVSLKAFGIEGIDAAKQHVWEKLTDTPDGHLAVNDKSDPDHIKDVFGMSKKAYKRAIGGLYKDGKITINEQGISIIKK